MSKTTSATQASTAARSAPKSRPSVSRRSSSSVPSKPAVGVNPALHDRATSKCTQVLKLLRRNNGASVAELQEATGWQAHSVRGFLSGTVKKRMGLSVTSVKPDDGERRYLIGKA